MIIIFKLINKLKCKFGSHHYYLVKELTPWSRKIGCKHCGLFFAMNDDLRVVIPWDSDLEQFYKILGVL